MKTNQRKKSAQEINKREGKLPACLDDQLSGIGCFNQQTIT